MRGNSNNFTANTFDPTTGTGAVSGTQPSTGGSINWSTVQGAFVLNGRIWYGQGGKFYYMTWDGANGFGTPQLVDPYNDPYWDAGGQRFIADRHAPTPARPRTSTPSCPT